MSETKLVILASCSALLLFVGLGIGDDFEAIRLLRAAGISGAWWVALNILIVLARD